MNSINDENISIVEIFKNYYEAVLIKYTQEVPRLLAEKKIMAALTLASELDNDIGSIHADLSEMYGTIRSKLTLLEKYSPEAIGILNKNNAFSGIIFKELPLTNGLFMYCGETRPENLTQGNIYYGIPGIKPLQNESLLVSKVSNIKEIIFQEIEYYIRIMSGFIEDHWGIKEVRHETNSETSDRYISKAVKMEVWRRDKGVCVECGSQDRLEYDHIIPVAKGGSNTARNVQILCETCNRSKSANIT